MKARRPPRVVALPEPWPKEATCNEVISWCAKRQADFLLLFAEAYRERNNTHMTENVKLLRGIATKLDQFRRMKVREWNQATESNSKIEASPK